MSQAKGPQVPKNALMQLNEIKHGLEYKFMSQSGPVHSPTFVMSVEVNGNTYEGTGNSKKAAKAAAAEQALKSFVQVNSFISNCFRCDGCHAVMNSH